MKKILCLTLSATIFMASCSKKADVIQTPTTDKVTLNGSDYATIKIGTQTWTSVNYNGTGGVNYNGGTTNDAFNGKLYTIAEAKAITLPTGWRLPTSDDFTKLYTAQSSDAKSLMAKTTWTTANGTNTSGFNAVAAGYYSNSKYDGAGTDAVFITSSTMSNNPNIQASFNIYQQGATTTAVVTDIVKLSTDRGSLRFVKDN